MEKSQVTGIESELMRGFELAGNDGVHGKIPSNGN